MSNWATPWRGRYLEIRTEGRWEYAARPNGIDAAIIIAIDEAVDGLHVLLIEEYRIPLHANCLGFPAGLIGDENAGEDPALAAARELEEETGYRAARWRNLGRFASSPGLTDESLSIFEARDLTRVGPGGGVDGENIIVHCVPMTDIPHFVAEKRREGCAIDVKLLTLLGLSLVG